MPEDSPILRQKSQPVKKIDQNLAEFMREMGKTLKSQHDPEGVGLSAIQVSRPVRIFALNWKYLKKSEKSGKLGRSEVIYYLNPEIVSHSGERTLGEELMKEKDRPFLEGCLSVPDLYGEVLRWPEIKIKSQIVSENELIRLPRPETGLAMTENLDLSSLAARVFQHELDHLDGVLFTDHVVTEGGQLYKWDGKEMTEMKI